MKATAIRLQQRALAIFLVYVLAAVWAHHYAPGTVGFEAAE